jgi:hypothetical protein
MPCVHAAKASGAAGLANLAVSGQCEQRDVDRTAQTSANHRRAFWRAPLFEVGAIQRPS